jgi:hypothetical protein
MSRLSTAQRVQVVSVSALVEVNSVRATCRMTGLAGHVWSIEEMVKLMDGRSILFFMVCRK